MTECDTCANYSYDEEYEEYVCDVNMDEDDLVRFDNMGSSLFY